jgi:hypothetical protein
MDEDDETKNVFAWRQPFSEVSSVRRFISRRAGSVFAALSFSSFLSSQYAPYEYGLGPRPNLNANGGPELEGLIYRTGTRKSELTLKRLNGSLKGCAASYTLLQRMHTKHIII